MASQDNIPVAQVVYEAPQYEYQARPQAQQLSRGFHNSQGAPMPVQISQEQATGRNREIENQIRRRDEDDDCFCLGAVLLCCCCCCYS